MITADEAFDRAKDIQRDADQMKFELTALQPRTTAEQWNAWSALSDASNRLYSAGIWLARHDEKTKETKPCPDPT